MVPDHAPVTALACAGATDADVEELAALVDGFVWVTAAGGHCASDRNGHDGFLEIVDCDFPIRCRSPTPVVETHQAGGRLKESLSNCSDPLWSLKSSTPANGRDSGFATAGCPTDVDAGGKGHVSLPAAEPSTLVPLGRSVPPSNSQPASRCVLCDVTVARVHLGFEFCSRLRLLIFFLHAWHSFDERRRLYDASDPRSAASASPHAISWQIPSSRGSSTSPCPQ